MEAKLEINGQFDTFDVFNEIKTLAENLGCKVQLLSSQRLICSKKAAKNSFSLKHCVITTTIGVFVTLLEITQPSLVEIIKKDYKKDIMIKSGNYSVHIKNTEDIAEALKLLEELKEKEQLRDNDN